MHSYNQQYNTVAISGFVRSIGCAFAIIDSYLQGEYSLPAQISLLLFIPWFITGTIFFEFWWIVRHTTLLTRSIPLRFLVLFLGIFTLFLSIAALVGAGLRGDSGTKIGFYSFNLILNIIYAGVLLRFYYVFFQPARYFGYGPETTQNPEPQDNGAEQPYRDEEDADVVKGPLYQLYETLRPVPTPPLLDVDPNEPNENLLDVDTEFVSGQLAAQRSSVVLSQVPDVMASSSKQRTSNKAPMRPQVTGESSQAGGQSQADGTSSRANSKSAAGTTVESSTRASEPPTQPDHPPNAPTPKVTDVSSVTQDTQNPPLAIRYRRNPLDPGHINFQWLVGMSAALTAISGYELIFYGIIPVATSSPNKQASLIIATACCHIIFVLLTWMRLFWRGPQGMWISMAALFLVVFTVILSPVGFCIWLARQTGLDYTSNRNQPVWMWLLAMMRLLLGGAQTTMCFFLILDCWTNIFPLQKRDL